MTAPAATSGVGSRGRPGPPTHSRGRPRRRLGLIERRRRRRFKSSGRPLVPSASARPLRQCGAAAVRRSRATTTVPSRGGPIGNRPRRFFPRPRRFLDPTGAALRESWSASQFAQAYATAGKTRPNRGGRVPTPDPPPLNIAARKQFPPPPGPGLHSSATANDFPDSIIALQL